MGLPERFGDVVRRRRRICELDLEYLEPLVREKASGSTFRASSRFSLV